MSQDSNQKNQHTDTSSPQPETYAPLSLQYTMPDVSRGYSVNQFDERFTATQVRALSEAVTELQQVVKVLHEQIGLLG